MRRARIGVALLLAGVLALPVGAHNNAVVHPEITDAALTLLRTTDMAAHGAGGGNPTDPCDECAYNELWDNRGPLRVTTRTVAESDNDGPYITAFNASMSDIVIGAVTEDGTGGMSVIQVLNHFYHARSGAGLLGANDSSRVRSQTIFEFGAGLQDYTDMSRERSWIYLGRFLHHVEDMSSPAHVHNDPHIPSSADEKDDYEGRYVPYELWVNTALRPVLNTATTIHTVDEADDIWPTPVAQGQQPPEGSLAGYIYNRSSYAGTLQFPTFTDPTQLPAGEFAEMFPDDPTDANNDGLHYDDGGMLGFAFWQIDGVGAYHYKNVYGNDDDTWWDEFASDAEVSGDPDGVEAFYYIENLNTDVTFAGAVVPVYHRQDYTQRWDPLANPSVANRKCVGGSSSGTVCFRSSDCGGFACQGVSLLERQRDALLRPAVEYVAGAAQWWYRIANLPPYLKRVEATQGSPATTKYLGSWTDVETMEDRVLPEITIVPDTHEMIPVINERNFTHVPSDREYINALDDLTLTLEFNEPMRDVSELQLLDSGGTPVVDLLALISGQAMPDNEAAQNMTGTEWTYTVKAATLQGVAMLLNGEFTLRVRAQDRNEHWQGIGGELDGTPQTPAKRNLTGGFACTGGTCYTWHTAATDERFVYDWTNGDRNHRLLFDTEPPETTISVTP